jgi:hypothetical protein
LIAGSATSLFTQAFLLHTVSAAEAQTLLVSVGPYVFYILPLCVCSCVVHACVHMLTSPKLPLRSAPLPPS